MIHITKKEVASFGEIIDDGGLWGNFFYHGKPMSRWLLFRFRFALWYMKTFRLFRRPIVKSKTPTAEGVPCEDTLPQKQTGRKA